MCTCCTPMSSIRGWWDRVTKHLVYSRNAGSEMKLPRIPVCEHKDTIPDFRLTKQKASWGTALAAQASLLPFVPPCTVSLLCSPQEETWSRVAAGTTQEGSSSHSAAPQPAQGFTLHWHSISPWQVFKQPPDYSQPPSGAKTKCVIAHLCKAVSQIWKYFCVTKDKNKSTTLRD